MGLRIGWFGERLVAMRRGRIGRRRDWDLMCLGFGEAETHFVEKMFCSSVLFPLVSGGFMEFFEHVSKVERSPVLFRVFLFSSCPFYSKVLYKKRDTYDYEYM